MRWMIVWAILVLGNSCLAADPALLFYLSGDKGLVADYAASGDTQPTVVRNVSIIQGGAKGPASQCADTQVMAFWAPGNIYAQRGTLSFFGARAITQLNNRVGL